MLGFIASQFEPPNREFNWVLAITSMPNTQRHNRSRCVINKTHLPVTLAYLSGTLQTASVWPFEQLLLFQLFLGHGISRGLGNHASRTSQTKYTCVVWWVSCCSSQLLRSWVVICSGHHRLLRSVIACREKLPHITESVS